MRFTHFFILLISLFFLGCKQENYQVTRIEGQRIEINDSLESDAKIEAFIKPYKEHIDKNLDSVLAYSVDTYNKTQGHLNTAIGNFMADAVFDRSNPIFMKRTGKEIDMVLLNHGGIRSIIPKGNITLRTAYQLMPFENSVVVVTMKGSQIFEMLNYLSKAKNAHPISKLKITLNKDFEIANATINSKEIDSSKVYYVATNDYLFYGGDNMHFFQPTDSLYILDYKIRNVLIDTFKSIDTLEIEVDDRFIQTP